MFPCLCDVIYCTRRENNTGFAFTGSTRQVAVCTAANTRFTRGVDEWNLPHPTFLLSLLLLFRQEVGGNETGNTPSSLRWVRYAKSICFSTRIGDESSNLCELPPCFAIPANETALSSDFLKIEDGRRGRSQRGMKKRNPHPRLESSDSSSSTYQPTCTHTLPTHPALKKFSTPLRTDGQTEKGGSLSTNFAERRGENGIDRRDDPRFPILFRIQDLYNARRGLYNGQMASETDKKT